MEQGFTSQSTQNRSFRDVLLNQSLCSVLKKTKPTKLTNNAKPKWSKLTHKHTKIQTKPLKPTKTNPN